MTGSGPPPWVSIAGCGQAIGPSRRGWHHGRMPEPLILRRLTSADEAQAKAADRDLRADGFQFLPGGAGQSWADFLRRTELHEQGIDLPTGIVPDSFLVGVVRDHIVGRVSIRHELNDHLRRIGGHIGYAVRPAFRRRGYATEMLRQSLPLAAELGIEAALVTCDDNNLGSIKVIEACGGVLEDVVATDTVPKRRYWIRTR